jgi:large subunit ribosomal protein L22
MQFATQEFRAAARFQRVSPQKARLVLDLIKHRRVEDAMNTLAFTRKGVAPAISKLLRSAVENANYLGQEKGIDVDIDNLYVKRAIANEGPRMKRIRPAPMGRAYRYQRRMAHIEIALAEKAAPQANGNLATVVTEEPAQAAPAKQGKTAGATRKGGQKKAAAKKSGAKKKAPGKKK